MSTINDTDQFLVQRGQNSYKQSAVDLMSTIADTDLMLIQRGTESFKVTCEDVKDQLGGGGAPSAPVLDSVTLAQNPPVDANRYTGKSFTSTTANSGGVATTLEMTGSVTGNLNIKAGSDPITTNAYPGTGSTDVVLTLAGETNLGDVIEVGDTVTANVSYTPETSQIDSVSVSTLSASFASSGTIDISALPAGETFVIVSILSGKKGGTGGEKRDVGSPRGGGGGGGGGAGEVYYRKYTREEYIARYGTEYVQSISNNFEGFTLYTGGSNGATGTDYPGAEAGTNGPAFPGDLTGLNEALGGSVVFTAGAGGNGGAISDYQFPLDAGGSGDGGTGGLIAASDNITVPSAPNGGNGSRGSGDGKGFSGEGGRGWGAGGGGGAGAGRDQSGSGSPGTGGNGQPGINIVVIGNGGTVLTLTDDTDIELFQADDLVQNVYEQSTASPSRATSVSVDKFSSNIKNRDFTTCFDGEVDTVGTFNSEIGSTSVTITFPMNQAEAIKDTGDLWFRPIILASGYFPSVAFDVGGSKNMAATNEKPAGSSTTGWYKIARSDIPAGATAITSYRFRMNNSQNQAQSIGSFVIGDQALSETVTSVVPVKVTATNVSAKTITVDGGNWDASNQSQVWSNFLSVSDGELTNKYAPFDGDTSTQTAGTVGGSDIIFTPSGLTSGPYTVKVYCDWQHTVTVDGAACSNGGATSGVVAHTLPGTVNSITNITVNANNVTPDLNYILINNQMLVDAVDDSQVWSDGADTNWYYPNELDSSLRLFDGDLTTDNFGEKARVNFSGLTANQSIEAYFYTGGSIDTGGVDDQWEINGENISAIHPDPGPVANAKWVDVSSLFTFPVEITQLRSAINSSGGLFGLKVDGKFVIDQGIRDFGDSKVSTLSAKQGSGTVSDITGAQVTVTPFTDNCFKEGQYLTVNKTVNVSPVTDPIATYTKGTKTLTFDDAKDLVQFANGDAVYMSDASGTLANPTFTTSEVANVSSASGGSLTNATYQVIQKGGSYSLSGVTDDKYLSFIIIEDGERGVDGEPNGVFEPGGPGGAGGRGGKVYLSTMSKADYEDSYGNSFTFNGTNTVGGTLVSDENTGGAGGATGVQPDFTDYGSAGNVITAQSFTSLNTTFDKLFFTPGDAGAGGAGGRPQGYFGGGGGGGGGGVRVSSTEITLPSVPTGSDGTKGRANNNDGNDPRNGGLGGKGGEGWGGGGGGGGGEPSFAYSDRNPGTGGNGANGIAILVIHDAIADTAVTFTDATNLTKFQDGDSITDGTNTATVVGNPVINPPSMNVGGGSWIQLNDTLSVTKSGTGTVDSVSPSTKTMVLSASNDQWVDDYYVATASKPAVATTAYLKFNAAGAVTGYQATPVEPRAMDNTINPVLFFPATFPDTGTAPDTEFPDTSAYIQTSVQLKNPTGDSATKASNTVVPQTNARLIGPGEVGNNVDEIKAMGMQIATHDQRVADHTAAKRQQAIADFEANLRRYAP